MEEFDLKKLKYSFKNNEYDLEGLYNWILDNVEDDTCSGDEYAYNLIDDLFEGSSYNEVLMRNRRWIKYYKLREEFRKEI